MKSYIIDGLKYCVYWTEEVSEDQINEYCSVHKTIFNSDLRRNEFYIKYKNNIYGSSVHVLVYDSDSLVAIRSLWRNDIFGEKAYQPCDTGVLPTYRGKGLFYKMTKPAIDMVGDVLIYNFPNDNSRELYLNNGWILHRKVFKNLYTPNGYINNNHDEVISDSYVNWMFKGNKNIYISKRNKRFFLITPRHTGVYMIIGECSKNIYDSGCFKRKNFGIMFFRSDKKSMFSKLNHPTVIVAKGNIPGRIPYWKIDAI